MSNLFDQAVQAHQRELDQAFAAGEQHALVRTPALDTAAAIAAARVKRAGEIDKAYREGFEACAIYGTILVAAIVVCAFVITRVGVDLVEWLAS